MTPRPAWPHWDHDETPDDHQRPASPAERAAIAALLDRGVDLDQLDAAHVGRLVDGEVARQRQRDEGQAA